MAWAGVAMSVVSAISSIKKGQAEATAYGAQADALTVQADWTRFNAKQASLKHKQDAANELEATLLMQARINAQAGAGNMDPFSGNPMGLKIQALEVGGTNVAMAKGNQRIVQAQGNAMAKMQLHQAAQARDAAKGAKQAGMFGAAFAIAKGAAGFAQTSTPGQTNMFSNWSFG